MGPASDENGKLQVADYADCGFGSSSAPAAGANRGDEELLPATAVEVESAVLEHFPEEQREDAPFPTKVSCRGRGSEGDWRLGARSVQVLM